jgi:hypothetical protein
LRQRQANFLSSSETPRSIFFDPNLDNLAKNYQGPTGGNAETTTCKSRLDINRGFCDYLNPKNKSFQKAGGISDTFGDIPGYIRLFFAGLAGREVAGLPWGVGVEEQVC